MSDSSTSFTLTLDGLEVQAYPGETLWQVAKRAGETIPHLCFKDAPGYRADGNCRACMVEVEGERVLAASCIREAAPGMVVRSAGSSRVQTARKGVLELLLADQPDQSRSVQPFVGHGGPTGHRCRCRAPAPACPFRPGRAHRSPC